ncbi:hypothetical protein P7H06_02755 [Paenibacillus larvae]|nr:hypothetical protein [Paenibacillus larvae]MDT2258711.1 hypothetical protein [Paenibacillus larvae]
MMQGSETKNCKCRTKLNAMEEMAGGIQRIAESSSTISDSMVGPLETKRGNEAVQKAVWPDDSFRSPLRLLLPELYTW